MTRGDLVTVAPQGDHGTPRPAFVVQSDRFPDIATTTVLLVTSTLTDAPLIRMTIAPSPQNELRAPSQVMVDKAIFVRIEKLGSPFGRPGDAEMVQVSRSLALFLGIAG